MIPPRRLLLVLLPLSIACSAPPPQPVPQEPAAPATVVVPVVGHDLTWDVGVRSDPGVQGDAGAGDTDVVVPDGATVRFEVRSLDFLYAFAIPGLGVSEVAVPNLDRVVEVTPSPGSYVISGDVLCGLPHPPLERHLRVGRAAAPTTGAGPAPTASPVAPSVAPHPPMLGQVPPFELVDAGGRPFDSAQLEDRVWIAGLVTTTCRASCTLQAARMAELQRSLEASGEDVTLLTLAVDPERDDGAALAAYARDHDIDGRRWILLGGSGVPRLVTDGLRLPLRRAGSEVVHASTLVVVDGEGRIRGLLDGRTEPGRDTALDLARRLAALEPGQPPPSVDPPAPVRSPAPADEEANDVPRWLRERAAAQAAAAGAPPPFLFRERPGAFAGFRQRTVDDPGKPTHYDHGSAVAAADVDGDGRIDLFFANQGGPCALFRGEPGGSFTDATAGAHVDVGDRVAVGAAFADADNDGDPDLYVTVVREGNVLLENDGHGRFRDVSREAGVDHRGHSSGADFLDVDRDGLLDLLVSNVGAYTSDVVRKTSDAPPRRFHDAFPDAFAGHLKPERSESSVLYRNTGALHFVDVTRDYGLAGGHWSGDAVPFDANRDGWVDLYVLDMQGPDGYLENDRGRRFVDRTAELFGRTPWGSMAGSVADVDGDGQLDLYVLDMHSDMSADQDPARERSKSIMRWPESFLRSGGRSIYGNALFLGRSGGRYEEASDRMGVESYWPWGASAADLDADGWVDFFVTAGMGYPFRYGAGSVLLNRAGSGFVDVACLVGVEPRPILEVPWGDLDCDGADRELPVCTGRKGRLALRGAASSRSAVAADLDGDGDLDVVTNDFQGPPRLLLSERRDGRAASLLTIRLVGRASNRDGLGARVTVRAGGRSRVAVMDGQSGYLGQSSLPVAFGLGQDIAESVEVAWPSGEIQTIAPVPSSPRPLVVAEP